MESCKGKIGANLGAVIESVEYVYNVFDRRIAKSVDADGAGVATPTVERFVYDGDELDLLEIYKVYPKAGKMSSKVKLGKWGNSLGVRIPKDIARALSFTEETEVKLITSGSRLIVEPIQRQKKYTIEELLQDTKPENVHQEIEWGKSVGQEW